MADFNLSVDADGVATIAWDCPDKSMNVLTMEGARALDALVAQTLADTLIRGVILTSGKPDFAAGMDLNVLAGLKEASGDCPQRGIFDSIMALHAVLRRIERAGRDPDARSGGKPVVAALPGTALGIGLEIPLACHRIIAADRPDAQIGLPEIRVGIFPGAGGTTRLVRKLGLLAAAPYLLEGKLSDPNSAQAVGLIDEVVPAEDLLARAKAWVLQAQGSDLVKPWDAKGYRMPGGAPYDRSGFLTFVGASAMVNGKTQGVYPAAKALLSAIYEGALVPFDVALRIEARWFTHVLMQPSSSAMIRSLFLNKQALEKGARRPDLPKEKVRRLGVLGAGMMGAGIAHVAAKAGIEVVLIDTTQQAADRGKAHAAGIVKNDRKRGKLTEDMTAEVLARIMPGTDYAALSGCDLIIEAVFEDPQVKAGVIARAEAAMDADAILATNTSTLPITGLAQASTRPAQFIGMHFFSPVDRMLLVEVIRSTATGDRAVAHALDFIRQIRKTPIVVYDARFFYANRCIISYLNEGMRMLREGVTPALIENGARLSGMPLGPLQLLDETSLDLGARIARITRAQLGAAYPDEEGDEVLFWMVEQGRTGRTAQAGFYEYDGTGRRQRLWPGLADRFPSAGVQPDLVTVQNRLILIQALEAVRALEQGVVRDIREGDVGAVLGWGFAPWSGGPFSWLDMRGAGAVVATCDALEARFGQRFRAPALLQEHARRGHGFYYDRASRAA